MKRVHLELNLPDDLAKNAESAGLLAPEAIEERMRIVRRLSVSPP
jgi:hypothetical protein